MREILFRAKRIDNGEWVEGFPFLMYWDGCEMWCIGVNPLSANDYSEIIGQNVDWFFIDPETLCQFTGLTDKNCKRIWENDIVKCNKRKDGFELYKVLWRKYYADFGVDPLDFGVQYPISLGENEQDIKGCNYEIIGNIFDTPELLKGE